MTMSPERDVQERYLAAAIQFEPLLGAKDENTARLLALVEEAAAAGARVIVMPEMAVTGYCFRDRAEIAPLVETVPGPSTALFGQIARRYGCYVVVGLAERDPATDLYYNTAVLVGPDGVAAAYRKSHAYISEPRWAAESVNQPPVVETPFGKLGLLICMDADYVEPARLLGVAGCEVALFPTCWLDDKAPAEAWMTRAYENGMYFVAADRYGLEREVQFSGGSCVLDPDGAVLAAQDSGDGIVYGEIDLARVRGRPFDPDGADDKLADRQPAFYAPLALHGYLWNPLEFHRLYGERSFPGGGVLRMAVVQLSGEPAPGEPVRREPGGLHASGALDDDPGGLRISEAAAEQLRALASAAVRDGAGLVVLPALPMLRRAPATAEQARGVAESINGATVTWLSALAIALEVYVVGSLIECVDAGDGVRLYLTAVLAGPQGIVGRYRALHPSRAEREWATPGDLGLPVFDLPQARVGLLYGRDALLPEPARVLALAGADVICAPSGLGGPAPCGLDASAVPFADAALRAASPRYFHLWRQRAHENNTVLAFANQGTPRGMGQSGIFGPEPGSAEALVDGEGTGYVVLDLDTSSLSERFATAPVRVKELLRKRVPAMYAPLVTPHALVE